MHRLFALTLLAIVTTAVGAHADASPDEGEAPLVIETEDAAAAPAETAPTPGANSLAASLTPHEASDGREAIDAWDDARGLRYGTGMFFPFTRGMEDAGIRGWARYPAAVVTVPLDVALLPVGLVAGFWGG